MRQPDNARTTRHQLDHSRLDPLETPHSGLPDSPDTDGKPQPESISRMSWSRTAHVHQDRGHAGGTPGRRRTTTRVWPAVTGAGIKPDRPEP
ncbi:hypothetical protein ACGFI9_37775, partial [Micromonospora sp. NPDC048930]|uniref:hypothetical protein n=1 Tax=Micromonospora sp. NPDC048930 TaxID=3364261 RepID=UPI003721F7DF